MPITTRYHSDHARSSPW